MLPLVMELDLPLPKGEIKALQNLISLQEFEVGG